MEKIKKLLSVLLVVTMVFTMFSMGISVSAENVSTETSGTNDSPLKVEVTTDKSSYGTFGVAEITVKVTNTSDDTIENISAEAIFDDLAPVGRNSETSKEVESLNAGESFSFSYKATVSPNNSNLGFFEKIILWFVQLFNGGITSIESKTQESETYIEYSTAITFGNIATNNIIRINGKANDIGTKVLSVSEKEFNTSTEKVNIYFYVEIENLSDDIILKCKEDENISIKLLDNGDYSENGDMQKNDNIYTGKFELNCEEEAEYNFYATSDNLKTNSVKINIIEPFSDSELDEMEIVDNAFVELKSSSDYKNSTEDEKKEKIQKLINELVSKGLILKNTVTYDNNLKQFYFQYKCEIDCYINVNEIEYENIFTDTTISTINLGRSVNRMLNSKTSFDNSKNNALYLCGATGVNQKDILLKVDTMNNLGLQTTVNFNTSVSTYKYALLGYDLITIIEHGQEFLNSNTRALALNEKVTKSKNKDYCNDIDQKRVKKVDGHYCIMPEFFSFYYEDKLEGVFVSIVSCESFGKNGKEDYKFAYELYEHCGVKCVLGYHNSVYMDYGIDFSYYYVNYLFLGAKSKEALDYAIEKCGNNDVEYVYKNLDRADEKVIKDAQKKEKNGKSAYPIITSYYTNPFDFGTFSVAIKENGNKVKNANAKVFWIENSKELLEENPNKHFEYNLKTDENGLLSQKLPIGNYGCIVNSEYTDKKYFTFIIEKDVETVVLNPVYLTPTTYLMGTVIDKSTSKPIENASVLLRLLDGDSGLYTAEYTCSTDENGQFEINVPTGTYTYEINKLDLFEDLYETATGTTTVNSATANILGTVYLTPKNSSGGGVEVATFLGKDISEVIKEYGNNYVEESIDGGHYYVYNNLLAFGITENAYAGLEPKKVLSISAVTTNVKLYQDFSSNMSYNDLVKIIPDIEKPEYFYNEPTDEFMYYTTFTYENYLFAYVWNKYLSDDDICYQAHVMFNPNYEERTIVDSGDCGADGDNVKWTLYDDGELVISGSGEMADYYFAPTKTPWCANISSITKITVKNGVSSIGDYAFNGCINLNSITIANSVTSIGGYAFLACNSLESISIPNSVSTIYEGTFSSCTNLKSVTIPVSVTSIGDSAFYNCTNLENIYYVGSMAEWCSINFSIYYPNEYDSIADKPQSSNPLFYAKNLFISGELITDVEFPVEITEIKQAAFFGYTNLKSVIIPEGITKIGGGAFYACSSLEKVDISSSVTNITHYAFGNCLNLSSISFNSNSKLNYIGTKAFSNCKTLTKIEIPESVTKIDLGAFYGCSNLEYITIPHNVSTLGNYAFSYCYNLKEVVLSDSMNVIQDETFLCCDSLKTVIIPISIISVEMSAFSGCSNISDVYYGGTKEQWNSIADYGYNHNLFNATIHYNS